MNEMRLILSQSSINIKKGFLNDFLLASVLDLVTD